MQIRFPEQPPHEMRIAAQEALDIGKAAIAPQNFGEGAPGSIVVLSLHCSGITL
jgi:hypothetical protein